MHDVLIPEIDENIPLPANAAEALPNLTPEAEVEMRARTIRLVSELTGTPLLPNEEDMEQAKGRGRSSTSCASPLRRSEQQHRRVVRGFEVWQPPLRTLPANGRVRDAPAVRQSRGLGNA